MKFSVRKLTALAMLCALSIILVTLIHFPIFPSANFLEYDPADIPIFIGTFTFGTVTGLVITLVTCIIQGVTGSAQSGVYGIIMHFIATGTFVAVSGLIYQRNKTKKSAVIALICGAVAWTLIMIPANLIVTPLFMGASDMVMSLMPLIILFNIIKSGVNAVITFAIYKYISGALRAFAEKCA